MLQTLATQSPDNGAKSPLVPSPVPPTTITKMHGVLDRATHVLKRLTCVEIDQLVDLIDNWLSMGINLSLAGPFVRPFTKTMKDCPWRCTLATLLPASEQYEETIMQRANFLTSNTNSRGSRATAATFEDYLASAVGSRICWETLGLFYVAAGRASLDVAVFPPLFASEEQRWTLTKTLSYIADCCLEVCLALDSLDDLHIILQYENFILHSRVHGDQSMLRGSLPTCLSSPD